MKKLFGSIAGLALLTGTAFAADLAPAPAPAYKMPAVAPAPTWSGFYVGAGFGYGMLDTDTTPAIDPNGPALTSTTNTAGKGWVGKVVAGYDYQFTNSLVAGVFASWDPSSIKGTMNTGSSAGLLQPLGGQQKETYDWAVGGRIGWLLTPTIFSYFDGGYTQAHFDSITVNNLTTGALTGTIASQNYSGWFLGSGFVTPLPFVNIPGLFLDTEYRFNTYNSHTLPVMTPAGAVAVVGGSPVDMRLRPVTQTITTALVYKFN